MGGSIVGVHRHQGIAITMLLINHVERAIALRDTSALLCALMDRMMSFPARLVQWCGYWAKSAKMTIVGRNRTVAGGALGRPASFGVLGGVARRTPMAPSRAEEIDSIKHLSRITTWFYIALYAFIVHDRRLVRVARARPAGGRVPSHAPTMASQLHREPGADEGRPSRRLAPWHHAWCSSSHILP